MVFFVASGGAKCFPFPKGGLAKISTKLWSTVTMKITVSNNLFEFIEVFIGKQQVEISCSPSSLVKKWTLLVIGIICFNYMTVVAYKTLLAGRGGSRGVKGAGTPLRFSIPNFLIIEIIGFCLITSSHKPNFHANHAHHAHHTQNWSVEPMTDFRLDPPLLAGI